MTTLLDVAQLTTVDNIYPGHYLEIDSDAGCAGNGPWCSKIIDSSEKGFKVEYDDGCSWHLPSMENYVNSYISSHGNTIHRFSK